MRTKRSLSRCKEVEEVYASVRLEIQLFYVLIRSNKEILKSQTSLCFERGDHCKSVSDVCRGRKTHLLLYEVVNSSENIELTIAVMSAGCGVPVQ